MAFGQDYPFDLFVTPSAAMNYTITLQPLDTRVTKVALSTQTTIPGVTVLLNPSEFTVQSAKEAIDLKISVAPTVTSKIVPINIVATTNVGATNQTFYFTLEKQRIVIIPSLVQFLAPPTLHISAGQKVSWFDTIEIDDDGNGYASIAFNDSSVSSPSLANFDIWSHTFDKPGTYTYHVTILGFGASSGTVVVE